MEVALLLGLGLRVNALQLPDYVKSVHAQSMASTQAIIQSRNQAPSGNIVSVSGFLVDVNIAKKFESMIQAAAKDGVTLTGTGYRSRESQIALRQANCGSSYADVYEKPEANCNPPTAIPGTSMHEKGLAVDFWFTADRQTATYKWLAAHAGTYGFYNRSDEAWHWSTNGL